MNVVDSSGWLEYFADADNADFFAGPIIDTDALIVPAISLFEVFKRILQQRGENDALQAIALMHQGRVIPMDAEIALSAAKLSVENQLPLADSVILATAHRHEATLWTQDRDFEGLKNVRYVPRISD